MDTRNQSFVALEALLSETGEFELLRAYEAATAPASSSHFGGDDHLTLTLLDEQGAPVHSETVPMIFNNGCAVASQRVSMAAIFKFVPLFKDARTVVATLGDSEVFSAAIAPDRPQLSELKLSLKENTVELSFTSNAPESGLRVFAQLQDGHLLGTRAEFKKEKAIVPIEALKGLGEVSFVVEATRDLRSSRAVSDSIALPQAATRAAIIEPIDGSSWSFGKRGSLIASIFDENGRHMSWDQERFGWAVNGEGHGDNRQLEAWAPEEAGDYHIQLLEREDNGQTQILGEARINVPPPNEYQLKYLQLMKGLH